MLLSCVLLALAGCIAIGIPVTTDPAVKLRDAFLLFERRGRPGTAESLIREAIEIYQSKGNEVGLADAYVTYGLFFRSASVGKLSDAYRAKGFYDRSASFDSRYAKSIEYFEMARAIYTTRQRFDRLTEVDLQLGLTFELMGDRQAACRAFERGEQSDREFLRRNPDARIKRPHLLKTSLPQGFATYEQFVESHKKRVGCP